jgi:hypothetical protein
MGAPNRGARNGPLHGEFHCLIAFDDGFVDVLDGLGPVPPIIVLSASQLFPGALQSFTRGSNARVVALRKGGSSHPQYESSEHPCNDNQLLHVSPLNRIEIRFAEAYQIRLAQFNILEAKESGCAGALNC